MGLLTDAFFRSAIESDDQLMQQLPAHAVYNNVANPDFDMQNVPMPYIIVNNDGGDNIGTTKDSTGEGGEDRTAISIRIVAKTNDGLRALAVKVRRIIYDYMRASDERIYAGAPIENDDLRPYDYQFSFSDISYEPQKPSHSVMLYYQCTTDNEIFHQQ